MEFYILVNDTKQGPFSLEELKSKNITRHTLVWRVGLSQWIAAEQVPELKELLNELPPEIPSAQPAIMPKTWLVESILVTLFCCLPFGIIGIIYAAKVENYFTRREYTLAQTYSNKAKTWTLWGFGIGLAGVLLYLLLILIAGVLPFAFLLPFANLNA